MRRKINGFLTHLLFVSEGSRKKNEQKIATKLKKNSVRRRATGKTGIWEDSGQERGGI